MRLPNTLMNSQNAAPPNRTQSAGSGAERHIQRPAGRSAPRAIASDMFNRLIGLVWRVSPPAARGLVKLAYPGSKSRAWLRLMWALIDQDREAAAEAARQAVLLGTADLTAIYLCAEEFIFDESYTITDGLPPSMAGDAETERVFRRIYSQERLILTGYPMPERAAEPPFQPLPERLLYMLHNALPLHSGGYATRTQGLLEGLQTHGYDPIGATRLGYPHDRAPDRDFGAVPADVKYRSIEYVRHVDPDHGLGSVPLYDYITANIEAHRPLIERSRPSLLHAASNFINGVTANALARQYGLPSIYEVRGLWELTRLSRDPDYEGSFPHRQYVRMETEACQNADHVFVLTAALKAEMERRGVDPDTMTVLPNGVDTELFRPAAPDLALKQSLGFADEDIIVGYVGSVVDYEGLDGLVDALARVQETRLKLLVVGDGDVLDTVRKRASKAGLDRRAVFTGRVPFDDVGRYHSIIDIAPFPRKGWPVCEMVSPLKPLEAMAMGKCVMVSNVAALAEMVRHDETGLVFQKDDPAALAALLDEVAGQADRRAALGTAARDFVTAERQWSDISAKVAGVYGRLLGHLPA